MAVVPTEPTAIDRLIEVEDRLRRGESGCGATTGGDDNFAVPDEPLPEPPAADVSRPIILRASCKKDASGALKYPNGTPWQFTGSTPNQLEGSSLTGATPGRVRVNTILTWNPEGSGDLNPTRQVGFPRSLMFKLPPGWWPLRLETFQVPVTDGAGHVEVTPDTGHVYFVPSYGQRPSAVDLTAIQWQAGGGSEGQGDGTLDPTGCGDGGPWADDADNDNTPTVPTSGGGGSVGAWTPLSFYSGSQDAGPAADGGTDDFFSYPASFRREGDVIRLRGVARVDSPGSFAKCTGQDFARTSFPSVTFLNANDWTTQGACTLRPGSGGDIQHSLPGDQRPAFVYLDGVSFAVEDA